MNLTISITTLYLLKLIYFFIYFIFNKFCYQSDRLKVMKVYKHAFNPFEKKKKILMILTTFKNLFNCPTKNTSVTTILF